jgi:hypothetical protein
VGYANNWLFYGTGGSIAEPRQTSTTSGAAVCGGFSTASAGSNRQVGAVAAGLIWFPQFEGEI